MKEFPLDINVVEKLGIRKWLDCNFEWPLNYKDSLDFWDDIFREVEHDISILRESFLKDILLVSSKFIHDKLFHIILAYNVKNNLNLRSLQPKTSELNSLYEQDSNSIEQFILPKVKQAESIKCYLKNTFKKIYAREKRVHPSSSNLLYVGRFKKEYEIISEKFNYNVIQIAPRQKNKKLPDLTEEVREYLKKLTTLIEYCVYKKGFEIPPYFSEVINCLEKLLLESAYMIKSYEGFFNKLNISKILIPRLGKLKFRAMSIAAMRASHSVISIGHGNDYAFSKIKGSTVELSMCNTFICQDNQSKLRFESKIKDSFLASQRNPTIVSIKSENENFVKNQRYKNRCKEIMVVEYPHINHLHRCSGGHWFLQAKLMLKIGELLSKEGFKAILKRHPDNINKYSDDIYSGRFDSIISEPYEEVHKKANIIIFPYIFSTTFPYTLKASKEVIIFDYIFEDVFDDVESLLRKQCRVVRSKLNEKEIWFSEVEFLKSLNH
ncbi:MAG: hypothetical protein NE327_08840 [Lentisphaeraceae bacterium]|nr:hypothetical protein [Lentisphaeraceae bacterium]